MASKRIEDLDPIARRKFEAWLIDCDRAGIDVLVYCTYRSGTEQDALYAVGRTVKGEGATKLKPMGRVVTNAKAGQSLHQYRVAIDCVPLWQGKAMWSGDLPSTPQDDRLYEKMAALAAKHGIEWAGNWVSFKEKAHFQYTGGLTLKDFQAGKKLVEGDKLRKAIDEAGKTEPAWMA